MSALLSLRVKGGSHALKLACLLYLAKADIARHKRPEVDCYLLQVAS